MTEYNPRKDGVKMRFTGLNNEPKIAKMMKKGGWKFLRRCEAGKKLYDYTGQDAKGEKYLISMKSDANRNGKVSDLSKEDKKSLKDLANSKGKKAIVVRMAYDGNNPKLTFKKL